MTTHNIDGPYFEDFAAGQRFAAPSVTVTEGHTALYQAITGDRLRLPLDRVLSQSVCGDARGLVHPMLVINLVNGQTTFASQHVKGNLFYRGLVLHQPVFVGDVAAAIAGAVEGAGQPGTVYELGGPEVLSFRELLERTLSYAGRRRMLISMPFWLAKLQALLTWPLPNAVRPLTVDQVRLLQTDNVVSADALKDGRTLSALGVAVPDSVGSIVPHYLERFRAKGQYSHYRG